MNLRITLRLLCAILALLAATRCTLIAGGNDDLEGITWQLISFTTPDGPLTLPTTPTPTLRFEDGHYTFDSGCNGVGGDYDMRDGAPRIKTIGMHLVYCGEEADGLLAMALEDAVANSIGSWSSYHLKGDELTIDYDGGQLVFTRGVPTGLRALPVQMPAKGERVHMEALLEGELRLVDGCLRVGEEYAGQQGELIVPGRRGSGQRSRTG